MAKFVFRLENILQIKYKLEEQSKIEFGNAMERLNNALHKLDILCKKRGIYEEKLKGLVSAGAKAIELNQVSEAVGIMKVKINDQKKIVAIEERNTDEARKKLGNAIQERKIFEKLKENEFEKFKHEINAQEMKEVDELVSYTYSPTKRQADV